MPTIEGDDTLCHNWQKHAFGDQGQTTAIRLIRLILSIRGDLNTAIIIASLDRGSRCFRG